MAIFFILLLTGCWGTDYIHSPARVRDIETNTIELAERIDSLFAAVEENESLLRGMSAQSGSRTADVIETLSALVEELDMTLGRIGTMSGSVQQDTTGNPNAQLLYSEAFSQFNQGSFDIAAGGFAEIVELYPTAPVADDAMYYMALCAEEVGSISEAVEKYMVMPYLYPNSERTPGAIKRAAEIYDSRGAISSRDRLYNLIITWYPRSEEAALVLEITSGAD